MSPTQVAPDGSIQEVPGYGASAPASLDEIVERNAVKRERDEAKQARAEAEQAERRQPWLNELDNLQKLVSAAEKQLRIATAKAEAAPLDPKLALDVVGAQRALQRCEAFLNSHLTNDPS
jgi:hypothetical protein